MAVLVMVGAMLATLGYYLFLFPAVTPPARDAPAARSVAAAMLVYQKAAIDWCLRSTCEDGPVPSGALILPPGFAPPWLAAQVDHGRVTTYVTSLKLSGTALVGGVEDLSEASPGAGRAGASGLVESRRDGESGRTAVPLAAGVPTGVPVVSQKVR